MWRRPWAWLGLICLLLIGSGLIWLYGHQPLERLGLSVGAIDQHGVPNANFVLHHEGVLPIRLTGVRVEGAPTPASVRYYSWSSGSEDLIQVDPAKHQPNAIISLPGWQIERGIVLDGSQDGFVLFWAEQDQITGPYTVTVYYRYLGLPMRLRLQEEPITRRFERRSAGGLPALRSWPVVDIEGEG